MSVVRVAFLPALRSVFTVTGATDADTERRSRLLLVISAALAILLVASSLFLRLASDTAYAWVVAFPIGVPATLATFLLARRARADAAALLLSVFVTSSLIVVVCAEGPGSNRMSAMIIGVVALGAVLSTRLAAVIGGGLLALVVGLAAAQAAGIYHPVDTYAVTEPLYAPFLRQSVAIAAMVVLLRRGYDRLQLQVRERERACAVAVDAARSINSSLEALVDERTSTLSATRDRLSELAAKLAADLNANLVLIRQQLGEFATAEAALGEHALRYVTKASNAVERLAVLTERLHEHARVGTAALRPARVDMDALVREVVEEYSRGSGRTRIDKRIEWHIDPVPPAWADPALVRTVIENLISNAIKFSRNRLPPHIHVGVDPQRGYFVRDNGVGFDPRQAGGLFSPFHRLHPEEEFEGHGLGLANVQRILERSGGDITVDSEPDRGATFYVRLPRAGELS
jgi:signal transduction histidine kinase